MGYGVGRVAEELRLGILGSCQAGAEWLGQRPDWVHLGCGHRYCVLSL